MDKKQLEFLVRYWRTLARALRRSGIEHPGPSGLDRAADDLAAILQRANENDLNARLAAIGQKAGRVYGVTNERGVE
jgi:hypothetical protein